MQNTVHRYQGHFKKILRALTYPGRLVDFKAYESYGQVLSDEIIELAMTLVDGEVGLCLANDDQSAFEEVAIRTNARKAELKEADYIIVPLNYFDNLSQVIAEAKRGGYINPDESATIIVEIPAFTEEPSLRLEGPGIDGYIEVGMDKVDTWLDVRNEAVAKFPMGVDLIFASEDGRLMGLPRSSQVERIAGE